MSRLLEPIRLPVDSPLAQSLQAAEEQGEPLTVDVGEVSYRVLVERAVPVRGTQADTLSAAGSWEGLVDPEALKQQIKEERGSDRSPASL